MNDEDLHELLELKSENKTLRAEVKRLKDINLLYKQTSFSGIDIPGDIDNHLKIEAS